MSTPNRSFRRIRLLLGVLLTTCALLVSACGTGGGASSGSSEPDATGSGPVQAFVSIPPQRHFVESIGGKHVQTSVLLPPSASPALYEPKPSDLQKLSKADVYFGIDVPFERAMSDRIQAAGGDDMRWVKTWQDVNRGQLSKGKPDPHIWLSPRLVKTQADSIAAALTRLDPEHAQEYRSNLERFKTRVDAVNADIARTLEPYSGKSFMSFHPAWNYFANDYDLTMIPIESGGKEPTAGQLRQLIKRANKLDIHAVFVQPQFSKSDARTIAKQVGATVQPLDPLAPDWETNMRKVASTLANALNGSS